MLYRLCQDTYQAQPLPGLRDAAGSPISAPEVLAQTFAQYYETQYAPRESLPAEEIDRFLADLPPRALSDEARDRLDLPLSAEELGEALGGLNTGKAPGPNGSPCEFMKMFHLQLGLRYKKALEVARDRGRLPTDWRHAEIGFFCKPGRPQDSPESYRPISLLNFEAKILAKALVNHLLPYITDLIHADQAGFMPHRATRHNIRRAHLVVEAVRAAGIPAALLLADIDRAFDSLSWPYLRALLLRLNLGPRFLSYIHLLYTDLTAAWCSERWPCTKKVNQDKETSNCSCGPLSVVAVLVATAGHREDRKTKGTAPAVRLQALRCSLQGHHEEKEKETSNCSCDNRHCSAHSGGHTQKFFGVLLPPAPSTETKKPVLQSSSPPQHPRQKQRSRLSERQDEELNVLLECDSSVLDSIQKLLKVYKIRRKVNFLPCPELSLWAVLPSEGNEKVSAVLENSPDSSTFLTPDPRVEAMGWRLVTSKDHNVLSAFPGMQFGNIKEYHKYRYTKGVPEGVRDLPPGVALPLESNLSYMNGISFSKGCYIGQELTARTHYTGVIRKRLMPVQLVPPLPPGLSAIPSGAEISTVSGKSAGKYRAGEDATGLALLRLAHINEQLRVNVSDSFIDLTTSLPEWWPQ
ncbi:iron-sulfur cluster assembly factor IBA57, mitochondrial [Lissotriton helveticus]